MRKVKVCCSCGRSSEYDLCNVCSSKNRHIGYAYSIPYEYSFKPSLDPLGLNTEFKLGVELEYESYNPNSCDDITRVFNSEAYFVFVKKDASLRSRYAGEIVTVPASLQVHRHFWERFFSLRPGKRFNIAALPTCGMHVHIGKERLTYSQIAKMYSFINLSHNAEFIYAVAGRKSNRYSAIMQYQKYGDCLYNFKTFTVRSRYVGLNLRPKETVELRIFRATMSQMRFFARLEFAHALVTACAPGNGLKNCVFYENFLDWVLNREREYPYFIKYLYSKSLIN